MMDDRTGFVHYRSDMVQLWNGLWVHKNDFETRQPQEFVRAKTDPKALLDVRPEPATTGVCNFASPYIGATTVPTPIGPFTEFAGIGDMAVEASAGVENCPFIIYNERGTIT